MEFGTALKYEAGMNQILEVTQAVLRSSRVASSTVPDLSLRVRCFEQSMHSQKCSIRLAEVGKPKKRPPSIRISNLEQRGFAHLEIIRLDAETTRIFDATQPAKRCPFCNFFRSKDFFSP